MVSIRGHACDSSLVNLGLLLCTGDQLCHPPGNEGEARLHREGHFTLRHAGLVLGCWWGALYSSLGLGSCVMAGGRASHTITWVILLLASCFPWHLRKLRVRVTLDTNAAHLMESCITHGTWEKNKKIPSGDTVFQFGDMAATSTFPWNKDPLLLGSVLADFKEFEIFILFPDSFSMSRSL